MGFLVTFLPKFGFHLKIIFFLPDFAFGFFRADNAPPKDRFFRTMLLAMVGNKEKKQKHAGRPLQKIQSQVEHD